MKIVVAFFFMLFSISIVAQKKYALVIGAQHYTGLPSLRNSLADAVAISSSLRGKGFQVESLYDPKTKKEIKDAVNRYFNQMRDQVGGVGIIFYAGHGMQYEGENYIIPISATLKSPADLEDGCVRMNTVMAVLKSTSKSLNILLLDACRSLPSFTRGSEEGLDRMEAPEGSIIVFATQAGRVASDGVGANGLFTSKLIKVMNEPNLNITEVFKKVKQQVYIDSKETQLPSIEDNSIGSDFYFISVKGNKPQVNSTGTSVIAIESVPDFGYDKDAVKIVTIGNQQWMDKNLNVDHYRNGDPITMVTSNSEWINAEDNRQPAWCFYQDEPSNEEKFGKIYNGYVIADPRGLCPSGWHVPSFSEVNELRDFLGENEAGKKLKTTHSWKDNNNGTDQYGFAGLPAGQRYGIRPSDYTNKYDLRNALVDFWTSTYDRRRREDQNQMYAFVLHCSNDLLTGFSQEMGAGYYVRCLKD
ncbi:hypothetical protein BH09BAC3_BH09BAC3_21570 [soil metagenome]